MNSHPFLLPRQIRPRASALAALVFASALMASHASAQTFSDWTPMFQGIDYSSLTETSPQDEQMYAVRIDLDAPGISFETTPISPTAVSQGYETTSQTTGAFLTSVGAQVAINANFFSNVQTTPEPEDLSGLAVSNGSVVSPADPNYQSLFLTADNIATIGSSSSNSIFNAVSGVQVLENGVAMTPNSTAGDPTGLDPRTDVGISQNGEYLYLLAIDGRSSTAAGVTDLQAGQVLLQLGAYNGLNLDGGGSTALVASNGTSGSYSVLNNPSGGTQRLDGNNLAVFAEPLANTPPPITPPTTTPVSTSGTYSQAVLNDNPALYYQLTETGGTTAVDSSGNEHDGTFPAKGVTLGQASTPILSQASTTANFNGSSGTHVSVAHTASMNAGSFTIAAWADPSANATSFQAVVSERNDKGSGAAGNAGFILYDGPASGSSSSVWQFWLGGSQTLTYNYEGRNQNGMGLGPVATPNQWAFVVGTFSANGGPDANGRYTGTEDLYLNGVLELTLNNISYLPDTSSNPLYIGGGENELNPGDGFDCNGNISQVALFDTALTGSQISGLYSAATAQAVPEPSTLAMMAAGFLSLIYFVRRRTQG